MKFAFVVFILSFFGIQFIETQQCDGIDDNSRLDCFPELYASESKCIARGCCWRPSGQPAYLATPYGVPYCFFPTNYKGYNITSVSSEIDTTTVTLRRVKPSGFPNDIQDVTLDLIEISESVLRVRFTDANHKRFQPQLPKLNIPKFKQPHLYNTSVLSNCVLLVTRISTGKNVFSTDLCKLIFSDQFHQLSSKLPSNYIYGLGEHRDKFRKEAKWTRYTFFNSDQPPKPDAALYGSHPFYFTVEDGYGHSSGVFLLNSNPMDIVLNPEPSITYRPIGGILDFFIFIANSPDEVVNDYIKLIGLPSMPPLWSLGFHLCRYGYNSLTETVAAFNRTRNAHIPFEVQWNDIDYMDKYNDFTYDKTNFKHLPQFVDHIHKLGMKYALILDPGVSGGEVKGTHPPYDDGMKMDIFIKNSSGQVLIGKVWNKSNKTVFPDFTNPNCDKYWEKQLRNLHNKIAYDGVWLDMNEIANFVEGSLWGCPDNSIENPPYSPGDKVMREGGICLTSKHHAGLHYNIHNLYSSYQSKATSLSLNQIIPAKRQLILSRATFPGIGMYAAHWDGDISSTWEDMKSSIPSLLDFNVFGIPMIGSDICGFIGDTTVELCARWMALGAFYPFSRNHNHKDAIPQDPAILGPTVVEASRNALTTRYTLLPYLYTLFYRAHKFGETVVRPLFFLNPNDTTAFEIETQFMWGSGLMIVPALEKRIISIEAYFPIGRWYKYTTLEMIYSEGQYFQVPAPIDQIQLFVRGGTIIPISAEVLLTKELHEKPFRLLVALDEDNEAFGELYWDDGESADSESKLKFNLVQFVAKDNTLTIKPKHVGYKQKVLSKIIIAGVLREPQSVFINNKEDSFVYRSNFKWFEVTTDEALFSNLNMTWF